MKVSGHRGGNYLEANSPGGEFSFISLAKFLVSKMS